MSAVAAAFGSGHRDRLPHKYHETTWCLFRTLAVLRQTFSAPAARAIALARASTLDPSVDARTW